MRSLLLLLLVACAACGDDDVANDPWDLRGPDLPISLPDLAGCQAASFNGFPGVSGVERRLDCACGCLIDPLTGGQGLWAKTEVSGTVSATPAGASFVVDGSAGPAFATLGSEQAAGSFFLDGDFDLRVDYHVDALPPGGRTAMRVQLADGTFWELARSKDASGEDRHAAQLAGVAASSVTAQSAGTLRLLRAAFTLVAEVDGVEIARTTAASASRLAIYLSSGVVGCALADAGVPDGGTCGLAASLRDVRLASGALVDRR